MIDEGITFFDIGDTEKELLLDILNFDVDENGIIIERGTGSPHICPITREKVRFNDASILPGSTVLINTSAISLSEYFSRFLDQD